MTANLPETDQKRIVIVGAGFGGIRLARNLRNSGYQVVLIDKNNYHTFQPLLYQVATGGLEPDSIAFPLRKLFPKRDNVFVRIADVELIEPALQQIHTDIGTISYDYLVLAAGSANNFFGNENIAQNAFVLKSVLEAVDLRSMILQTFEQAVRTPNEEDRDKLMDFVIVGGGPTGVETAGALSELRKHVLPNDYPELDFRCMQIHLIEAMDNLLPGMSEASGNDAVRALEKMGVLIHLNTMVEDYDGKVVTTQDGATFESYTVLWAAGVKGVTFEGIPQNALGKGQRMLVDNYHKVKGLENVFAIGDNALMFTEDYPQGHPQLAPVAIQQAKHLAGNFKAKMKEKPLTEFSYFDKGTMATIGRNKAVVDVAKIHLKGFIAWIAWMFVHLLFLMGFRNRLVVLINWVWSYLTYDKGTRLIIRPHEKTEVAPLST